MQSISGDNHHVGVGGGGGEGGNTIGVDHDNFFHKHIISRQSARQQVSWALELPLHRLFEYRAVQVTTTRRSLTRKSFHTHIEYCFLITGLIISLGGAAARVHNSFDDHHQKEQEEGVWPGEHNRQPIGRSLEK